MSAATIRTWIIRTAEGVGVDRCVDVVDEAEAGPVGTVNHVITPVLLITIITTTATTTITNTKINVAV